MAAHSIPTCFSCGKALDFAPGNVGRSETCSNCRADVRVCRNCRHYDPAAYNACSEPMAERVVEKDKRNFCDYFSLSGGAAGQKREDDQKAEALKKLDALFKK